MPPPQDLAAIQVPTPVYYLDNVKCLNHTETPLSSDKGAVYDF